MGNIEMAGKSAEDAAELASTSGGRSLLVSLITEGTYPFVDGGVSVWCDQLVRGLNGHRFRIEAITATGTEQPVWTRPPNVVGLQKFPIWITSGAPRPSGRCGRTIKRTLQAFFAGFKTPLDGRSSYEQLRTLAAYARDGRLQRALMSDDAVRLVLMSMAQEPWSGRGANRPASPRVADAVASLRMLEHFLRPLAAAPLPADISHATSNGIGVLRALAAKWERGTPFILTEHGVYLRERYIAMGPQSMPHHQRAFLLGFFGSLCAAAYHAADVVAPCCEYNRSWELVSGADPTTIQPVYNGIHALSFEPSSSEPSVPTLAWVGRIDPLKDIKTLLRAFAEVRLRIPEARLRMYGGTPLGNEGYHRECVALQHQLGLGECATFEGRFTSITEAYHSGHVLVSTSISEGFPYSVLEAMASGRAMVATDVGGVREAVGDCGLMVTPRDHKAIARACIELLTDDVRRRSLAQLGRARVLERFTLALCLARYESIYENLDGRVNPIAASAPYQLATTARGAA